MKRVNSCGMTTTILLNVSPLSGCSYDPAEEPNDCHSLPALAKPVMDCTQGSPCNELHYSEERTRHFITSLVTVCVWVWECVWLADWLAACTGKWLCTRGLMENLKYFIVPIFQLHNTMKVHVWMPKAKQSNSQALAEWHQASRITLWEEKTQTDAERKLTWGAACQHQHCIAVAMLSSKRMIFGTYSRRLSYPHSLIAHPLLAPCPPFYIHSLFLDGVLPNGPAKLNVTGWKSSVWSVVQFLQMHTAFPCLPGEFLSAGHLCELSFLGHLLTVEHLEMW